MMVEMNLTLLSRLTDEDWKKIERWEARGRPAMVDRIELIEARSEAAVLREILAEEHRALPPEERERRKAASKQFLISTIIGAVCHRTR